MTSTESPQPATIRHAGWLAAAKPVSGADRPEFSAEPTTATPSSAPWLDADRSACEAHQCGGSGCLALTRSPAGVAAIVRPGPGHASTS
jgi:hypothetical protein